MLVSLLKLRRTAADLRRLTRAQQRALSLVITLLRALLQGKATHSRPRRALKDLKLAKAIPERAHSPVIAMQCARRHPFSARMGEKPLLGQLKAKFWQEKNDHETPSAPLSTALRTVCKYERSPRQWAKQADHGFKIGRCC